MTMSRRESSVLDEISLIASSRNQSAMSEFIKRYKNREEALVEIEDCAIELAKSKSIPNDKSVMFLVDYLVEKNDSNNNVAGRIFGYANRMDKLDEIFRNGGTLGAIFSYGYLGNAVILERILLNERYSSRYNLEEAARGLAEGGYLNNRDKLLKFLTHIKEEDLRKIILELPGIDSNVVTDVTELLEQAAELRGYMISYRISYDQAHQFSPMMKKIDEEFPVTFPAFILTDIDRRRDKIQNALEHVKETTNPKLNSNLTL